MVFCSMPAEERGVGGEDGGEVELPDARHDEADAAHPLVEVSHDPAKGRRSVGELSVTLSFTSNSTEYKRNILEILMTELAGNIFISIMVVVQV